MAKTAVSSKNSGSKAESRITKTGGRVVKAVAVAAAAAAAMKVAQKARGRKYVYFFGNGKADGDRTMKDLLGGKGSGLAEMTNAGLPVPPGFTISTEACTLYYQEKRKTPGVVDQQMQENLQKLEKAIGAKLRSEE